MNFKPLTLSDVITLKPFFYRQPYELCPYLLSSIISWQCDSYRAFYEVMGDELIVSIDMKDRPSLFLPITSMDRVPPQRLKDLAREAGMTSIFPVSDQYLLYHGREQVEALFDIKEKPEHSDYVYRQEDLAELKGNRYSKKRNLINQFKRNYLRKGRVDVVPIAPSDISECIDFLEEWCLSNNCDGNDMDELACEKQAAIHTLEHLEVFGATGLLLRLDGEVSAFGIGARLTRTMGVLNFEKAFSDIKGLYQYFDRECARRMFAGVQYINKENDMGEPGLQKAKKSYYPARMVIAYEFTVR